MRRRNCIMATVCPRQDTEALAWFLLEDFHSASPIFLFLHLSLSADVGSLSVSSLVSSQTSVSSTELAFKPVRHHRWIEGLRRNRRIIHFSDFNSEHKSVNKSALSYRALPGIRFVLPYFTLIQSNIGLSVSRLIKNELLNLFIV